MNPVQSEGFTLGEILVVVAIVAIIAGVALPLLSSQDSKKLEVAAQEVGNALRFAVSEARRTGSHILVDAKTAAGRLKVVKSDATGANLGSVNDPLTKRALDIDTAGSAFSGPVSMTAKFVGGGTPYTQLLISPTTQLTAFKLEAFDGPTANMGLLESGTIELKLGDSNVRVTIDKSTGFVAIP